MFRAFIFACGALLSAGAQAQSFPCRYAAADDELAICASDTLSRLDERMAGLYADLRRTLGGLALARLEATQQDWLARRGRCHDNAACIASVYRARIDELTNWD
jgi:uncharacterized protein